MGGNVVRPSRYGAGGIEGRSPFMDLWRSEDAQRNAEALFFQYPEAFIALAEYDALGHRVLKRVERGPKVSRLSQVVGIGLLRRAVTLYAGFRRLLEGSSIDPAKVVLRALLETFFAMQYLVHGGPVPGDLSETPEKQDERERRARLFRTAALRAKVYRRQAALDGEWGSKTPFSPEKRKEVETEIRAYRDELERDFAQENGAFGSFRFEEKGKDPRYHDRAKWFSFGPGARPTSIRGLAKLLGYGQQYEVLYSPLSALAHPQDIEQDLLIGDGVAEVAHPYQPEGFPLLTKWGVLCQEATITAFCHAFQRDSLEDVRETEARFWPAVNALPSDIPRGYMYGGVPPPLQLATPWVVPS